MYTFIRDWLQSAPQKTQGTFLAPNHVLLLVYFQFFIVVKSGTTIIAFKKNVDIIRT